MDGLLNDVQDGPPRNKKTGQLSFGKSNLWKRTQEHEGNSGGDVRRCEETISNNNNGIDMT
jgi:hypothetical protein